MGEITWKNVNSIASADGVSHAYNNLGRAIMGVGGSVSDFLEDRIKAREKAFQQQEDANTQYVIGRLNSAQTPEEMKAIKDSGLTDIGWLQQNVGGKYGLFNGEKYNKEFSDWAPNVYKRAQANDNIKDYSEANQQAIKDYYAAYARGDTAGMAKAIQNTDASIKTTGELSKSVYDARRQAESDAMARAKHASDMRSANLSTLNSWGKGIDAKINQDTAEISREAGALYNLYPHETLPPDQMLEKYGDDRQKALVKSAREFQQSATSKYLSALEQAGQDTAGFVVRNGGASTVKTSSGSSESSKQSSTSASISNPSTSTPTTTATSDSSYTFNTPQITGSVSVPQLGQNILNVGQQTEPAVNAPESSVQPQSSVNNAELFRNLAAPVSAINQALESLPGGGQESYTVTQLQNQFNPRIDEMLQQDGTRIQKAIDQVAQGNNSFKRLIRSDDQGNELPITGSDLIGKALKRQANIKAQKYEDPEGAMELKTVQEIIDSGSALGHLFARAMKDGDKQALAEINRKLAEGYKKGEEAKNRVIGDMLFKLDPTHYKNDGQVNVIREIALGQEHYTESNGKKVKWESKMDSRIGEQLLTGDLSGKDVAKYLGLNARLDSDTAQAFDTITRYAKDNGWSESRLYRALKAAEITVRTAKERDDSWHAENHGGKWDISATTMNDMISAAKIAGNLTDADIEQIRGFLTDTNRAFDTNKTALAFDYANRNTQYNDKGQIVTYRENSADPLAEQLPQLVRNKSDIEKVSRLMNQVKALNEYTSNAHSAEITTDYDGISSTSRVTLPSKVSEIKKTIPDFRSGDVILPKDILKSLRGDIDDPIGLKIALHSMGIMVDKGQKVHFVSSKDFNKMTQLVNKKAGE